MSDDRLCILFLCTGNRCRSQMAEGWARHLKGDELLPASAGVMANGLDPDAVRVMREAGVDISDQRSQRVDDVADQPFDYVITLCAHAHETCPAFPGEATVLHFGFDDPPHLTAGMEDEDERLAVYRRVRDEIHRLVETLPESLRS